MVPIQDISSFHALESASHGESAFQGITIGLDFLDKYKVNN